MTWHAGPLCGCDAALRPRGRAVGGPREAQETHMARTRGRRPRVSTQVHVGACVGHHVARGVGIWRAHGSVGLGKIVGVVMRKRYTAPLFNLKFFQNFFRVGLCPTRLLPFAGDVDARQASDMFSNDRMVSIAWTGVHAIEITTRAENVNLSEIYLPLIWRHVDGSKILDLHRTTTKERRNLQCLH